jgi:uncharacterized paraquat-inducible protein A
MRNTHVTRSGSKKPYQRDSNWIGTSRCTVCSEYTSIVNVVATGKKFCGRCDTDLYKVTGSLEKDRWMKTGRR